MEFEIKMYIKKESGDRYVEIAKNKPLPRQITDKTQYFEYRLIEARHLLGVYNMDKKASPCTEFIIKHEQNIIEDEKGEMTGGVSFSLYIEKDSFNIYYTYTNEDGSIIHSVWTEKKP